MVPLPFSGCMVDDDCECDNRKFSILDIDKLDVVGTEDSGASDTTRLSGVIIDLIVNIELLALDENGRNGSFFNPAFACTCAPDNIQETISEISIISTGDFGDENPAGNELNRLFTPEIGYNSGGKGIPLVLLYGENIDDPVRGTNRFGMINSPISNDVHVFTIKITLDNGQVLEGQTKPIIVELI